MPNETLKYISETFLSLFFSKIGRGLCRFDVAESTATIHRFDSIIFIKRIKRKKQNQLADGIGPVRWLVLVLVWAD